MPETPTPPVADALRDAARQLKRQARLLEQLAAAQQDPTELRRLRARLDLLDLAPLADQLDAWLTQEAATRRPRLATGLRQACEDLGIELVVITREPLELRLAPLGVVVDVEADKAKLTFGRELVEQCGAQTDQVLAARQRALQALESGAWDPAAFHRALRTAWQRAPGDGWKELVDVLPQLVLALQDKRFARDPSAKNFRPYARARLCYDLWRLRRDRSLLVDGWRLSLGSATGGSTRDKKRVFWLEDDQGRGQYFLTLRFVRDEPASELQDD